MAKSKSERFWESVDQLAQEKIYQLLTNSVPLPNLKLITKTYQFTDKNNELEGLFLHKDADYRTLLDDVRNQSTDYGTPDPHQVAEEISVNYFYLVFKALLADLSNCYGFDPSYFENLTDV